MELNHNRALNSHLNHRVSQSDAIIFPSTSYSTSRFNLPFVSLCKMMNEAAQDNALKSFSFCHP